MLAIGGSSSQLTSECQAVPSAKGDVASAWILHQFRPAVHAGGGRVDVQLAEAAAELHVLFVVDVLIAKEEHEVFEQPSAQRVDRFVVERFTKIDAVNFGTDVAGERPELDDVVSHSSLRRCTGGLRRHNHTQQFVEV